MLFDPRPKERRSELFDREKELSELRRAAEKGSPLILCLGVRRVGKTSLVKVFINESGYPSIYIDARRLLELGYSKAGLYTLLSEEFTRARGRLAALVEYLRGLRGISIGEYSVEFDWGKKGASITSILERLDDYAGERGTPFLVVVDEAQELRFLKGSRKLDFRRIMAYSYDNLRNVKLLLTGSEVGLLYGFLELDNYESPLYGRARDEVAIDRFSREQSVEFLEAGFAEAGVTVPEKEVERAVEALDGIPGWLALYGYEVIRAGVAGALERVLDWAISTAISELERVARHSELYRHILRAVALGYKRWSTVKRVTEAWIGRHVADETLRRCLRRLTEMSILAKAGDEYDFLDPIYREASKRL